MNGNSSHRFGTRTTGSIDPSALREGLASPGMDTRYWCSRGTVGTVDGQGSVHFDDPHAIWIGPEGVECDVVLQPLGQRVTALWGGGGDVSDIAPIHPGDQVFVEFPDGNLAGGKIAGIIHSRSNKQPMASGKPIFDNKRRLIFAKNVVIDIRTAGLNGADPVQFLIDQAGTVTTTATRINHGASDVTEQFILGTSYRRDTTTLYQNLQTALAAMQAAAIGPMAGFQPGLAAAVQALISFATSAQTNEDYLSKVNYGK